MSSDEFENALQQLYSPTQAQYVLVIGTFGVVLALSLCQDHDKNTKICTHVMLMLCMVVPVILAKSTMLIYGMAILGALLELLGVSVTEHMTQVFVFSESVTDKLLLIFPVMLVQYLICVINIFIGPWLPYIFLTIGISMVAMVAYKYGEFNKEA